MIVAKLQSAVTKEVVHCNALEELSTMEPIYFARSFEPSEKILALVKILK